MGIRVWGLVVGYAALAVAGTSTGDSQAGADTASRQAVPELGREAKGSLRAWKVGAVGLGTVAIGSAVYTTVLSDGWWSGPQGRFHWESPANDFHYAHNLDKAGHFYAGLWLGEGFRDAYSWAGMSDAYSYTMAGFSAGAVHLGMEMKDGLSPGWGFSPWDVLAGTAGGFYPMAQRHLPVPFGWIDIKASYWRNSRAYLDSPVEPNVHVWVDDYVNQTFWASVKVHKALPDRAKDWWPGWLALAFGLGIDGATFQTKYSGSREVYLAPDWDLEAIVKPNSVVGRKVVRYVGFLKMPGPAWKVYPRSEVYWVFPSEFHF